MYVDNLLDRSDELMHYGTPRHSGRYPWGSGERPFQRNKSLGTYTPKDDVWLKYREYMDSKGDDYWDNNMDATRAIFKDRRKDVKKAERLEKRDARTEKRMGRYWNSYETSVALGRANQKINAEERNGNTLSVEEKRQILAKEFRRFKRNEALARAALIGALDTVLLATGAPVIFYSDTDQNDYVAALLDKADDLEHGGPGSGRFPWGSGERPFQHRTPAGFMLPARGQSSAGRHETSSSSSKSTGSSNSSSSNTGSSSSSSSNTGDSSQYDHYKAEEAQYKRNEERRKQQKHAADMADRARKIRKENAKEKTDKAKAEEKEREDLEDAYWKEVTNMTNQLSSIRTHANNLRAASKPVKDVTKKMSDQQLRELTDRLKLENSYLRELNTRQSYNARPDKVENLLGLLSDVSSMGRSASKVYRTANKQRKYL